MARDSVPKQAAVGGTTETFPRREIGLIALQSDGFVEDDLKRMLSAVAALATVRINNPDSITVENLIDLRGHLELAARGLAERPGIETVAFACTSGSILIGESEIAATIRQGFPSERWLEVATPSDAAARALHALDARRIAMVVPYLENVGLQVAEHFEKLGFNIAALTCLGIESDVAITAVRPEDWLDLLRRQKAPVDAVFVSCTSVRASPVVAKAEEAIDRSVICSNQALAWHLAGLIRQQARAAIPGRLGAIGGRTGADE
jgi:maleate isomerase